MDREIIEQVRYTLTRNEAEAAIRYWLLGKKDILSDEHTNIRFKSDGTVHAITCTTVKSAPLPQPPEHPS